MTFLASVTAIHSEEGSTKDGQRGPAHHRKAGLGAWKEARNQKQLHFQGRRNVSKRQQQAHRQAERNRSFSLCLLPYVPQAPLIGITGLQGNEACRVLTPDYGNLGLEPKTSLIISTLYHPLVNNFNAMILQSFCVCV